MELPQKMLLEQKRKEFIKEALSHKVYECEGAPCIYKMKNGECLLSKCKEEIGGWNETNSR